MSPDGYDMIAHHAINLIGFYEENISKDISDVDAIIALNGAKILIDMVESSQDVVTHVDKTNSFIETGIMSSKAPTAPAFKPTAQAEADGEIAASDKKTQVAEGNFAPQPYQANTNVSLNINSTGGVETNNESNFNVPNQSNIGTRFNEKVARDARDFVQVFKIKQNSNNYAAFRSAAGYGSTATGQDYLAAATERINYNSLGDPHSDKVGKYILEECIPCADRLFALSDILGFPSELLDMLEDDIRSKLEDLKRIFDILFNPPVTYFDFCELLKFLSFMCVPDLYAIVTFLMNYLKQYLILKGLTNNFGLAINALMSAIMSPFLLGLNALFDSYLAMILGPIDCVLDALTEQLRKLDATRDIGGNEFGMKGKHTYDAPVSIEKSLGNFSPQRFQQDLHKSFNQGYKNSRDTLYDTDENGEKDFPKGSAFKKDNGDKEKRPLLWTMEALGTGLGFIFNSLLFARDYVNSKIEESRKLIEDFLKKKTKWRNEGLGYMELAQQIGALVGIILTIIRLKTGKAFQCETDQDLMNFLNESSGTPGLDNFDTVPFPDLPPEVQDLFPPTGGDGGGNDTGWAWVPKSLPNIKVYDNQVISEKEVPGYGVIRTPIRFTKKCKGEISFGDDEKVQRWLANLKKQAL